ncbi:hypothetical protein HOLleu_15646 [Holothuria leucospilota]|uniref:Uncharacterized protein n=1 Tax=Holothuria leucospilota TaxID=206669 RepID=A0A9Q1C550_HOLLE|nr:hypothetical protein HOLleu_15646 [Holothuria leucospilota]
MVLSCVVTRLVAKEVVSESPPVAMVVTVVVVSGSLFIPVVTSCVVSLSLVVADWVPSVRLVNGGVSSDTVSGVVVSTSVVRCVFNSVDCSTVVTSGSRVWESVVTCVVSPRVLNCVVSASAAVPPVVKLCEVVISVSPIVLPEDMVLSCVVTGLVA